MLQAKVARVVAYFCNHSETGPTTQRRFYETVNIGDSTFVFDVLELTRDMRELLILRDRFIVTQSA